MAGAADLQLGDLSTSEQLTRHKWIDGRPIYRKVINLGTGPNSSSKEVAHGITGLDVLIRMYGSTGGYRSLPVSITSSVSGMTIIGLARVISTGNVVWTTSYNASNETGYVVLEYVKTA